MSLEQNQDILDNEVDTLKKSDMNQNKAIAGLKNRVEKLETGAKS